MWRGCFLRRQRRTYVCIHGRRPKEFSCSSAWRVFAAGCFAVAAYQEVFLLFLDERAASGSAYAVQCDCLFQFLLPRGFFVETGSFIAAGGQITVHGWSSHSGLISPAASNPFRRTIRVIAKHESSNFTLVVYTLPKQLFHEGSHWLERCTATGNRPVLRLRAVFLATPPMLVTHSVTGTAAASDRVFPRRVFEILLC